MDLSVGAFGSEVASLHRELLAGGFEIPVSEVERRFFGPATRDAVRLLQIAHELNATGVADERTRGAIVAATAAVRESPSLPPCPPAAYRVPDQLGEKALTAALRVRLTGTPADGSRRPVKTPQEVIWVDKGDEVLVHLDSTQARIIAQGLLVSIDLECDQTGRTPLVVAFALGPGSDKAALLAATDELPRGNGLLAARWGPAVQAAAWAGLLSLAQDHASERGEAPLGLTLDGGQLHLQAGPALRLA